MYAPPQLAFRVYSVVGDPGGIVRVKLCVLLSCRSGTFTAGAAFGLTVTWGGPVVLTVTGLDVLVTKFPVMVSVTLLDVEGLPVVYCTTAVIWPLLAGSELVTPPAGCVTTQFCIVPQ